MAIQFQLPLFPLQMVVFPGEPVNLHIFEPRYKQLINEVKSTEITFGIPAFIDQKVMDYGTEMRLLEIVNKKPSGEMDIKTEAMGIFKVHDFYSQLVDKLYPGGVVERLPQLDSEIDYNIAEEILVLITELYQMLNINKTPPPSASDLRAYNIGHSVGMSIHQEYQLLTIEKETDRQRFILEHLRRILPVVKQTETMRKKIQMNGHFKNFDPLEFNL